MESGGDTGQAWNDGTGGQHLGELVAAAPVRRTHAAHMRVEATRW
ncbi:hypothetical protein ACIBO5_23640 [Nonomuraea angiospora]|nr:hypothetical protein [Nonomuraea angiospora]MDX3109002.1 hypothetical protein [Nonomuraea angiospora]